MNFVTGISKLNGILTLTEFNNIQTPNRPNIIYGFLFTYVDTSVTLSLFVTVRGSGSLHQEEFLSVFILMKERRRPSVSLFSLLIRTLLLFYSD